MAAAAPIVRIQAGAFPRSVIWPGEKILRFAQNDRGEAQDDNGEAQDDNGGKLSF